MLTKILHPWLDSGFVDHCILLTTHSFVSLLEILQGKLCDVVVDQEAAWREELIAVLSDVPQPVRVVMRYLFTFLNQSVTHSPGLVSAELSHLYVD